MDWEGIFGNLSPASFFNFSFIGEYGTYILQAVGYTLLLAVCSVLLAVVPALLLAIMRLSKNRLVIPMSRFIPGVVALALNSSAYVAEIFRGGILAVDIGQTEAARSLGLTSWASMQLVVLPQAIKNVLPALANEIVTMVKESSICSTLGMAELMFAAKTVAGATYITLAPYTVAALIYFCINYPASKAIEAIERRMRRGDKQ